MSGNSKHFIQSGAIGLPADIQQGAPGVDGANAYLFIRWASDSSGTSMSEDSTGMTYLGVANTTTNTVPEASEFTWVYIGENAPTNLYNFTGANSQDVVRTGQVTYNVLYGTAASLNVGITVDASPEEGDIMILSFPNVNIAGTVNIFNTYDLVQSIVDTGNFTVIASYANAAWGVSCFSGTEDYISTTLIKDSTVTNAKLQYDYITIAYPDGTDTGTGLVLGGTLNFPDINLASSDWVSGVLPIANGGTGLSTCLNGIVIGNGTTYGVASPGTDYLTASSSNTMTNKSINANDNPISNLTLSNFNAAVISSDGTFGSPNNTTVPTTQAVKTLADRISTGVKYIQDVDVLADSLLDLSGDETIDGLLISTASPAITRVLCIGQTDASENGVYTPNTGGAWTRATDQNIASEIGQSWVHVTRGTTYAGTTYICKNYTTFTLETDDIIYEEAPQLSYDASNGLTQTGATFSIDTDITVDKTTAQSLSNKTLVSPVLTTPDLNGGTVDAITSLTVANNVDIGSFELRAQTFQSDVTTGTAPLIVASTTKVTNLNADSVDGKDVGSSAGNIPELATGAVSGKLDVAFLNKAAPSGDVLGTSDTQVITGKTISGSSNTLSNIAKSSITGAPSGDFIGTTDSQSMSNKTLTSPVINTGVSGTALITSTTLSGANNTTFPSSLAAKTYIDTISNKWQAMSSTTRTSDSSFTSTTALYKGTVIRFLISGTYYYGQIVDRSGSGTYTYTISGAPMSSNPTSISYDTYDNLEMVEWYTDSTYAASAYTTLINRTTGKPASIGILWNKPKSYLVGINIAHVTADSGATIQPKIEVTHAGNAVNTVLEANTSIVVGKADFSTTYYSIEYGQSIDLKITQATGGTPAHDAAGLWVQLIYVKE